MTCEKEYYFDVHTMLEDYKFHSFTCVSGDKVIKIRYGICDLLEYLFGGEVEYDYDVERLIHKYKIRNDDIVYYEFSVLNEAFIYETLEVRLLRMCEEYDAYMRYKFRDYKEYKL